MTKSLHVARHASLYKNIVPIIIREDLKRDDMVFKATELALKMGCVRDGDHISVVEGPRVTRAAIDQLGALQLIKVQQGETVEQ